MQLSMSEFGHMKLNASVLACSNWLQLIDLENLVKAKLNYRQEKRASRRNVAFTYAGPLRERGEKVRLPGYCFVKKHHFLYVGLSALDEPGQLTWVRNRWWEVGVKPEYETYSPVRLLPRTLVEPLINAAQEAFGFTATSKTLQAYSMVWVSWVMGLVDHWDEDGHPVFMRILKPAPTSLEPASQHDHDNELWYLENASREEPVRVLKTPCHPDKDPHFAAINPYDQAPF